MSTVFMAAALSHAQLTVEYVDHMSSEPSYIEQRQLSAFGDLQRVERQEVGGGDKMLLERWQ